MMNPKEYMMNNIRDESIKWYGFLLVLMPILNNYAFFINGIGVGDALVGIGFIYTFIKQIIANKPIRAYRYYGFIGYGIIVSLITVLIHPSFSSRDVFIRVALTIFYTFIILLSDKKYINMKWMLNFYLKIVFAACLFLYVQYFSFYILHRPLIGLIPWLKWNYSMTDTTEYINLYTNTFKQIFRPTSFFAEPAQFALYIGPALVFVLFNKVQVKRTMLTAFFFTISMILSTSTNAVVFCVVIWLCYYLYALRRSENMHKVPLVFLLSFIFLLIFVPFVFRTQSVQYAIARINGLRTTQAGGSAYERVIKGFVIWNQLLPMEKVFGIGFGTYDSYYSLGTIKVFNGFVEYMSSISYILVSTGLIGLVLYVLSLLQFIKGKSAVSSALMVLLIMAMFSSSIFNSAIYTLILIFILYDEKELTKNVAIED